MTVVLKVSRRAILLAGASGGLGLALGVYAGARRERWKKRVPARAQAFAPNAFVAIEGDGQVTVWITKSEMGQGVRTALAMLVVEELDAPWSAVRVEQALANRNYGDQATAGSESVTSLFEELRRAGATARQMLVTAAAQVWAVDPGACHAEAGEVHHATGRRMRFGALAPLAAKLPVPEHVALKDPSRFRLLGTRVPRIDVPEKVDGSASYGIDVRLPGMNYAVVARSPSVGGSVRRFDEAAARQVAGVRDVFSIDRGVVVVADGTWPALQGRERLAVTWNPGPLAGVSSEQIEAALEARGARPPTLA
jgi:isoquinoline 1-oxidoreductase beta subunit